MSHTALKTSQTEYSIKILTGSDKGLVYPLQSQQISIGRSPQNDLVFSSDPKISRQHATLHIESKGVKVVDVSDKNFILINGQQQKEALIVNGTRIRIGDTELELYHTPFHVQPSSQPPLKAVPHATTPQPSKSSAQPHTASPSHASYFQHSSPQAPAQSTGQRGRFYTLIALIGALFYYLLSDSPAAKEDPLKIRSSEEIMKESEESRRRQKALREARQKKGQSTRQYDEAQASYIRCFRDYSQAQYTRALQHCQAALALFPQHKLAERYLLLSRKKRDEKIQFQLRQGRIHLDRGQYTQCMSKLKEVMYELRDPTNRSFKEARRMHSECKTLAEGRF